MLRRWWPEVLLAVLAGVGFLGCLGSVELWGKREQRATAEAIDTVDHHHWLVAEIQGRPRLEKPPLPRWSIAALMLLTGRRDEWVIRLPGALAGMAMIALIYALGRRMGGRALGLASAFILCSTGFFVGEMRQASNDCLLALFVTLAAVRRLSASARRESNRSSPPVPQANRGRWFWNLVFYTALGLGFLTKGPIILLLVGVDARPLPRFCPAIDAGPAQAWRRLGPLDIRIPRAGLAGRRPGERSRSAAGLVAGDVGKDGALAHPRASLACPSDRAVARIGAPLDADRRRRRALAIVSAIADSSRDRVRQPEPSIAGQQRGRDNVWFAWWWAVGNLLVFCTWVVAKPNYYLPCLPGMALLTGSTWLRLARAGRGDGKGAVAARAILQAQWVLMFVAAAVAPFVVRPWLPASLWPWSVAIAVAVAASVAASVTSGGGGPMPCRSHRSRRPASLAS